MSTGRAASGQAGQLAGWSEGSSSFLGGELAEHYS